MTPKVTYFFWILMLAFGLMILMVATQILGKRNINGVQVGNKEAVVTFTINNRLQQLVNLSFELNAKILNTNKVEKNSQSLTDSVNMLGYNSSVLQKLNTESNAEADFNKLDELISKQVGFSLNILNSSNSGKLRDSLQKTKITDSVYSRALLLQQKLENNLQTTLNNNTHKSNVLSSYNKALAIIAITAVLILCTIIINRHLKQVQLIKQLEAATEQARKSANIKDQFLANMSHEIRTPLNAIKGFSHLLSQTNLGSDQKKYAEIINESSGNLLNIVNDILDISKIEAGKLSIVNKEFDIKRVLQSLDQIFRVQASEKNLTYQQQYDNGIPDKLWGDPDRLLQILINLVSNGIKFTRQGLVKLSVSTKSLTRHKIWLQFVVEDTGIGIPDNKKGDVFKRFEQLHGGKDAVIQGTGLGLSIVKNLVTLMNGEIELDSEVDKGTVFKVIVPFEINNQLAKQTEVPLSGVSTKENYAGARVLVAEDNTVNQLLIRGFLHANNINPTVVDNGEMAIQSLTANEYDLILMDIQMPVMDGYIATSFIREKLNLQIPIVAMTAYVLPREVEKCYAAGMNAYLAKPIENKQLDAVLKRFLKSHEGKKDIMSISDDKVAFILNLSGGDAGMAIRILKEIKKEIPLVKDKLDIITASSDAKDLKHLLHSMVATFSPLGNDYLTVKAIEDARKLAEEPEQNSQSIANRCLKAMNGIENDIEERISILAKEKF